MDKILTFELDNEREVLELHLNEAGASELIEILETLKRNSLQDHEHLMTPSWAGKELTEEKQNLESELINHVKIMYWKD